jgi:ribosomal protein L7Ae-like RNA K-turn-binding protein
VNAENTEYMFMSITRIQGTVITGIKVAVKAKENDIIKHVIIAIILE